MLNAIKTKTQQFIKKKSKLVKKTDQLTRLYYINFALIIRKKKILYISINRSRSIIFHDYKNYIYEFNKFIHFALTRL